MDESLKQYIAFTFGNLGFFECDDMCFGLYNVPAMFQRLMQNCLGELNLTYCLIYLDVICKSFSCRWLKNIFIIYMSALTDLESII